MGPAETTAGLAARFGLPRAAAARLDALLAALEAEPDPHTTIRDRREAVDRHLADSLEGLRVDALRHAAALADIGAGAGFPGLPLAVALPRAQVDLVESAGRKCAVMERLARAASAPNARVVRARAEEWAAAEGAGAYDVVTARALAPLAVLVEYAAPLLRADGVLVAWKGARDTVEEGEAAVAAELLGMAHEATCRVVPFEGARDRHLHVYRKVKPTPDFVPRRPGMAVKRPLGG